MNNIIFLLFGILVGIVVGYYLGLWQYKAVLDTWKSAAFGWKEAYFALVKRVTNDL